MTVTFQWDLQCAPLVAKVDDLEDVIVGVYWRVLGRDGDYWAERIGGPLSLVPPGAANFIAFDEVLPTDVMGWTRTALGDQADAFEQEITAEIEAKQTADADPTTPRPKALVR